MKTLAERLADVATSGIVTSAPEQAVFVATVVVTVDGNLGGAVLHRLHGFPRDEVMEAILKAVRDGVETMKARSLS